MRRLGALAVIGAALAGGGIAGAAPAADECRGLQSCISVPGPWVVVPAHTATAAWRLECPEGLVAGLDARVSSPALSVTFDGLLGSPVNPGITTEAAALFTGRWAGARRETATFKPFIGCVRGGGGQRTPTGSGQLRPGRPVTVRVRELQVVPGRTVRRTLRCIEGERMLGAAHAVGVEGMRPPSISLVGGVRVVRTVRAGVIAVAASRAGRSSSPRVRVQLQAVCAA